MKISDHICPKDVGLKFMDALKTEGNRKKLQNDVEQGTADGSRQRSRERIFFSEISIVEVLLLFKHYFFRCLEKKNLRQKYLRPLLIPHF